MEYANTLKEGITEFARDLFDKIIAKQEDNLQNFIFSPMSIYTASLLLMAGAEGETLQELQRLLRVPSELQSGDIHKSFGSLILKYFEGSAEMELELANRLFLLKPIEILPEYTKQVGECYKSSVELLTALPNVEAQRCYMNAWVADKTKNKIKELLPMGSVDGDTVLAIINALYFRGSWLHPFNELATCESDFYCLNGEETKVQMMFENSNFPTACFEELDSMGIKLPFKHDGLHPQWEMLILLPNERNGLPKLLSQLRATGKLASVLAHKFEEEELYLNVPKFKIGEGKPLDVKELFQDCGVEQMFDSRANFSQLTRCNLSVDEALHKAILEVDEEGATAAAATAFTMAASATFPMKMIHVDHPFFVALICDSTVPVFVGYVVKPEYKETRTDEET